MKPNVKRYLIAAAAGLAIAFLIALTNDIFTQTRKSEVFRILSDAFFIVGVLLTSAGVILFASNKGLFDMLAYGVRTFFVSRKRDVKERKYKDYYEYKKAKGETKGSTAYLLLIGLALLGIAALCLIGYYN